MLVFYVTCISLISIFTGRASLPIMILFGIRLSILTGRASLPCIRSSSSSRLSRSDNSRSSRNSSFSFISRCILFVLSRLSNSFSNNSFIRLSNRLIDSSCFMVLSRLIGLLSSFILCYCILLFGGILGILISL